MEIKKSKKAIIYCRVSSKEQEDRGYSLEAQEKLLLDYSLSRDISIDKTFKISESASGKQIRKVFTEMLGYIKKNKVNIILCEKIDRLTRNLKDGAIISDWVIADPNREVHFVKENFIVSQNTRAHENLVWDMKVAIARFYTNNLSEEVKKGQKAKIEAGYIPCGLKFAYKTIGEKGHKIQVPDKKIAPYIKQAFNLYNSSNYTISRLSEVLHSEGFRTRDNKKVARSTLHRLLGDPFYCGIIIWKDKEYEGKHEAIISKELFYQVQEKLSRKYKAGQIKKHFHLFKGLITCAQCGSLISWETQKGHHYGRCKGFKGCSKTRYLKQEVVEDKLKEMMDKVKPKNKLVLNWINKALKEKHKDKQNYCQKTKENLNTQLNKLDNRLDKIYEDKIDEVISQEYYQKKYQEFNKQKQEIVNELSNLSKRVSNYYEIGIEIHNLAFELKNKYSSNQATVEEKRILINRIFTDLKVDSKLGFSVKYSPAFEFLANWMPKLNATSELLKLGEYYEKTGSLEPAHPVLLAYRDSFRTFFNKNTYKNQPKYL